MNIYEHIKHEHKQHRAMLEKLEQTSGDSEERQILFDTLKADVTAHANAEEQTIYAALLESPKTQEKARHSIHEHEKADSLFDDIDKTDMSSPGWLVSFKKLKDYLEHHMEEEEERIFELAQSIMSESQADALEVHFNDRKQSELKKA